MKIEPTGTAQNAAEKEDRATQEFYYDMFSLYLPQIGVSLPKHDVDVLVEREGVDPKCNLAVVYRAFCAGLDVASEVYSQLDLIQSGRSKRESRRKNEK